jgi:LuxR family transcriptional regulator, maltose regulon positive regulatory protein
MVTLLRTKTSIPPTSPRIINRSRLIEYMREGTKRALTIITAPAGFGKTTLAASWAQEGYVKTAWLTLQPQEQQRDLFLTHLIMALQEIVPQVGQTAMAMIGLRSFDGALFALVNDLAEVDFEFALVLDDYHSADCSETADVIQFLLENCPAAFHLIIVTRVFPSLNLSRLRALDQVIDITSDDLRFTPEEINTFFKANTGLKLPVKDLEKLNRSIEGWAVGIQLAAMAMSRKPSLWDKFAESDYIFDYLADEVLLRETSEVQDFLKKSAIFDRFCASLCAHTFNPDVPVENKNEKYKKLITYLQRSNLFLVSLDKTGEWFRYHSLFSDFLRRQLPEEQGVEIVARASEWFEQNGLIDEAIHYAIKSENYQRAACLLEETYIDILAKGEQASIEEWTSAIPVEALDKHPRLWLAKGWASVMSINHQEAAECLKKVDETLHLEKKHKSLWNEARSLRILSNILSGIMVSTNEISSIIESLSDQDDFLRGLLYFNLGGSFMFQGETEQAVQAFQEAVYCTQKSKNLLVYIMAQAALGENLQWNGKLIQAEHLFTEAIDYTKKTMGEHSFLLGYLYNNYSDLLREQNRIDEAIHIAEMGISYCMAWQPSASLDGQIVLARLLASQGNWEKSYERLELARKSTIQRNLMIIDSVITVYMIRLMLLQGNMERARHELRELNLDKLCPHPLRIMEFLIQLVVSRFNTMEYADDPQAAKLLIDPISNLAAEAEQRKRITHLLETLILLAYAQDSAGQGNDAIKSLNRALSIGAHSGYIRTFVDEGARLLNLLEKQRKHIQAPPAYLDKILSILRKEAAREPPMESDVPEGLTALTRRELEILSLLALGKSNQEIADDMFLAISTVKKHVANILDKLGVSNRIQAVMLAKKAGWLD